MTIQVGTPFPEVEKLPFAIVDGNPFATVDVKKEYEGKWVLLFSFPFAFTGLCQNELVEYSKIAAEFIARDCAVVGFSCDSQFTHQKWLAETPELKETQVRLLSDYNKGLTEAFGIKSAVGSAQRATFIIDPTGTVRFAMVTDITTGRNSEEALRVLDALQTGSFTACNWKKGQPTLA